MIRIIGTRNDGMKNYQQECWKKIFTRLFVLVLALFCVSFICSAETVSAQVVINEVSPASSPEWVELYNNSSDEVNLKDYLINFGADSQTLHFCESDKILGSGYKLINLDSNWLANAGDLVTLKSGDDEIDSIGYGTGYSLGKPTSTSSITRSPDGSLNWILATTVSPQGDIASFDCPTPVPTMTPTPTEVSSYKSTYKINSPVDGSGSVLDSVQIYVDGGYIHHEDDEILYFFDGHECYSGVDCGLGNHTISLRKSGYNSWEDTQNFTAGSNFEVNPVLAKLSTETPTSTPTKTPTPTSIATQKPSPISSQVSTLAGALEEKVSSLSGILGTQTETNDTPSPDSEKDSATKSKVPYLAIILIFFGLCFITVSVFSIIRNAKKENLEDN